MNQKNRILKDNERTILVSNVIVTTKIKDPKTGIESEVKQNIPKQGTMNLGKNEAKRIRTNNSRLKNPKKRNIA